MMIFNRSSTPVLLRLTGRTFSDVYEGTRTAVPELQNYFSPPSVCIAIEKKKPRKQVRQIFVNHFYWEQAEGEIDRKESPYFYLEREMKMKHRVCFALKNYFFDVAHQRQCPSGLPRLPSNALRLFRLFAGRVCLSARLCNLFYPVRPSIACSSVPASAAFGELDAALPGNMTGRFLLVVLARSRRKRPIFRVSQLTAGKYFAHPVRRCCRRTGFCLTIRERDPSLRCPRGFNQLQMTTGIRGSG